MFVKKMEIQEDVEADDAGERFDGPLLEEIGSSSAKGVYLLKTDTSIHYRYVIYGDSSKSIAEVVEQEDGGLEKRNPVMVMEISEIKVGSPISAVVETDQNMITISVVKTPVITEIIQKEE